MKRILKSSVAAWAAFVLVLALLIFTFSLRIKWWAFIDIFFFFMMAFTHLMATTTMKKSTEASRKLDKIALVAGCLGVVAFIIEWILLTI